MSDAPPIRVGQIGVANFGGYRRDSLRRSGAFRIVSAFDLNAEAQTTLVLVTHDRTLAARCGRTLSMAAGRLV